MASEPGRSALERSTLVDEIDFLAVKTAADGTRLANRRLALHGLRVRSYAVLALAATDVPVTQRDLAAFLSLDPSQIVALVDDLEQAGLVRRDVDPADRRSRVVSATPEGLEHFALARRETAEAEDELLAALTAEERDTLRLLLRKAVGLPAT